MLALKKAQSTIQIAREKEEGVNDQKEDGDNMFAKVKVRPKTPIYREIGNRIEDADKYEEKDRQTKAVIMLQRLLRGRAS